jgi:hypothetical protein
MEFVRVAVPTSNYVFKLYDECLVADAEASVTVLV